MVRGNHVPKRKNIMLPNVPIALLPSMWNHPRGCGNMPMPTKLNIPTEQDHHLVADQVLLWLSPSTHAYYMIKRRSWRPSKAHDYVNVLHTFQTSKGVEGIGSCKDTNFIHGLMVNFFHSMLLVAPPPIQPSRRDARAVGLEGGRGAKMKFLRRGGIGQKHWCMIATNYVSKGGPIPRFLRGVEMSQWALKSWWGLRFCMHEGLNIHLWLIRFLWFHGF